MVRNVIGEPTGTSMKFCEQMISAVKKYFSSTFDINIPDECITSIPLQWEGKVLERVEKLYDYLISDWKNAVQQADVILWATHSQGTPVSTLLLKRLIEDQVIQVRRQPISMLAMAGISHGPFPTLKGNVIVKVRKSTKGIQGYSNKDVYSILKQKLLENCSSLWIQIPIYQRCIESLWILYFKIK